MLNSVIISCDESTAHTLICFVVNDNQSIVLLFQFIQDTNGVISTGVLVAARQAVANMQAAPSGNER